MYKPKYGMTYHPLSCQNALPFTLCTFDCLIWSFRTVTKTAQMNPAFACGRAPRMKGPREGSCYSCYRYLTCHSLPLVSFLALSIPKVLPSSHVVNGLSWLSKAKCHPTPGDAVHQDHQKLIYALAKDLFIPSMGRRTIISPVLSPVRVALGNCRTVLLTRPFCGLYPLSPAHIK